MNENTQIAYDAIKRLDGDELEKLLEQIPPIKLISLITIGINIFYKGIHSEFDEIEKMNTH